MTHPLEDSKKGKRTSFITSTHMIFEIGVLKNFAIFTGNTSVYVVVFSCISIKKRLQHKCFLVNIAKFLRAAFLKNTSCGVSFLLLFNSIYLKTTVLQHSHSIVTMVTTKKRWEYNNATLLKLIYLPIQKVYIYI